LEPTPVAYREKFAWLSLVSATLCFGAYFVVTAMRPPAEAGTLEGLSQLWLYGACAAAHGIIVGLGQFMLGRRDRADERDWDIERRATTGAFWFLLIGVMLTGVVLPLLESGWTVANAALLAIVVSLLVQNVIQIWCYRRGLA